MKLTTQVFKSENVTVTFRNEEKILVTIETKDGCVTVEDGDAIMLKQVFENTNYIFRKRNS